MSEENNALLVVGSGLIGRCWASIFARGGWSVWMYDAIEGAADRCIASQLKDTVDQLHTSGLLGGQAADDVIARVRSVSSIQEGLSKDHVSFVIEAVPEVKAIKESVFAELSVHVAGSERWKAPQDLILASSTSNMPSSSFTAALPADVRARVLVTHPVNPPIAVPVVELVPSPDTHPQVVARARAVMERVRMSPITLQREVDGFVVNRLQYALLGEAFRLVMDGVASPEDVDKAICHGLGARWAFMGPFQTIDLNAPEGVRDYCDRYAEPLLDVLATQDNMRRWTPEVKAQVEAWARARTPVERLPEAAAWRDRLLMRLAVERDAHHAPPSLSYRSRRVDVSAAAAVAEQMRPSDADILRTLQHAMGELFEESLVEYCACPDLSAAPFHLERKGLGGRPVLIDMGGPKYVERPSKGRHVRFNSLSMAAAVGRSRAWVMGPGAAAASVVGVNAELIINDDTAKPHAASYSSKVVGDGWLQERYCSRDTGPLANVLVCDGEANTQVLHIRCARWRAGQAKPFVGAVREALATLPGVVAAGGVVRIEGEGAKIRAHVMPDWCDTDLDTDEKIHDWLHFYEMDVPVTGLSTFVTRDLGLDLRPDHTHFFSEHGACGHYHYDTTPDAIVYDAYYVFADELYRMEAPE